MITLIHIWEAKLPLFNNVHGRNNTDVTTSANILAYIITVVHIPLLYALFIHCTIWFAIPNKEITTCPTCLYKMKTLGS